MTRAVPPLRRAISNILFGIAVGLLGYYALTSAVTWVDQVRLRHELKRFGGVSAVVANDIAIKSGPQFDLEGWAAEDAAYWESLRDGDVFGRLVVPALELDVLIVKGVATADLKAGPGWAPYTDMPGATGNCGISGHRTTYLAPFRRIDELRAGDTIDLYSPFRRYRYTVRRTFTVTPDHVEVFDTTATPTLTLTACHPPFSARYRFVVQAEMVSAGRVANTTE